MSRWHTHTCTMKHACRPTGEPVSEDLVSALPSALRYIPLYNKSAAACNLVSQCAFSELAQ
jgi:hypothetical protein